MSDDSATPAKTPRARRTTKPATEEVVPVVTEPEVPGQEATETEVVEPVAATTGEVVVEEPEVSAETQEAPVEKTVPVVQTIYVHAPIPPKKRGNRGIGSLIAVLSAVLFGVLYAIVLTIIVAAQTGVTTLAFLGDFDFYIPILFFAVGFVLLVLIVNRANWWTYVLGSLLVALFVYFGTVGTGLLIGGIVMETPEGAARLFGQALSNPFVIAAALLSREVALWMGAAISARGRRLRTGNAEAQAAFERETVEKRAEYERATAAASVA